MESENERGSRGCKASCTSYAKLVYSDSGLLNPRKRCAGDGSGFEAVQERVSTPQSRAMFQSSTGGDRDMSASIKGSVERCNVATLSPIGSSRGHEGGSFWKAQGVGISVVGDFARLVSQGFVAKVRLDGMACRQHSAQDVRMEDN